MMQKPRCNGRHTNLWWIRNLKILKKYNSSLRTFFKNFSIILFCECNNFFNLNEWVSEWVIFVNFQRLYSTSTLILLMKFVLKTSIIPRVLVNKCSTFHHSISHFSAKTLIDLKSQCFIKIDIIGYGSAGWGFDSFEVHQKLKW